MKKSGRARKAAKGRTARQAAAILTRRSVKSGLPPGTLVHVGERKTESTRITVMEFAPDRVVEHESVSLEDAISFRGGPNPVWINVYGLQDVALIEKLGRQWGIHELVLEDIVNASQAPHVDFLDDYVFVVMNTVKFEPAAEDQPRMTGCEGIPLLDIDQISLVIGRDFVMAFHEEETDRLEPLRARIRGGHGLASLRQPDYLGYAVIDMVVDNYFIVLEGIGDAVEQVEADLTDRPDPSIPCRIHTYKSQLLELRRSVWPARDAVARLARGEHPLISRQTLPFLHDIGDHVVQILDMVDTQREVLSGLLDMHRSAVSLRMNEVMKILTIISTIFIPLTFIAGIYGMNFHNMPEIGSEWGYPLVWVAFIVLSLGMILFFRKKNWI